MSRQHRVGPYIAIYEHRLPTSGALEMWAKIRGRIVREDAVAASDSSAAVTARPPAVTFRDQDQATEWFEGICGASAFTWALHDRIGAARAVGSVAFATLAMAQRDARRVQEFSDQLTIELVEDSERVTWLGTHDARLALFAPRAFPTRVDALVAATVTIGLLPVASVAGYAIDADLAS